MNLLIFGHKNPDTDSTCSCVSLAYLKNELGNCATPCMLGEMRKEAEYAFNYFNVKKPKVISTVSEGDNVIIVDHNEYAQSVDGLEKATIIEIIDHHKLGGMKTILPLMVKIMPVGCTCTIVYTLFKENNIDIPYEIAGLLLSAILSDTLLFKSPTTTELDKKAAKELSKIAKVDMTKYAMDMFKYGSSLDGFSTEEIVNMDFKEFDISGKSVGIGQIFTMDIDSILGKKDDFINYLNSTKYDVFVLAITDIIREGSYLLYKCDDSTISKAFDIDAYQGVFASGIVSRKKQLVPNLTNIL